MHKLCTRKLVFVGVCVCCVRDRQPMAVRALCVRVLLEMCHVCDNLTLIRQSHHALGVCSWLHMSDVATGAVMTQSYQSWVIRCCVQAMCALINTHTHTHAHTLTFNNVKI